MNNEKPAKSNFKQLRGGIRAFVAGYLMTGNFRIDDAVVAAAAVGNSCFNCITGESLPVDDYEINADLIKKPTLCLTCLHDDDPSKEPLCNMTRFDQQGEPEFVCCLYEKTIMINQVFINNLVKFDMYKLKKILLLGKFKFP